MSIPAPAEPPDDPRYVDPEGDRRTLSRREQAQPVLAGLVVAALLVIVVMVITRPIGGNALPPKVTTDPIAITPQAAWDGTQSRRLPVTVDPDQGLVDGRTVTVTGSGFPVGKSVAAVVCTIAAGSQGVEACDISTSSFMAGTTTIVGTDGTFTIHYVVHRHIQVGTSQVDCGTGNVDPAAYHQAVATYGPLVRITTPGAFSCLIAVGAIDDYDQSGGALVAFAGEAYRPFEVDPTPDTTTAPSAPGPSTTAGPTAATGGSTVPPTSAGSASGTAPDTTTTSEATSPSTDPTGSTPSTVTDPAPGPALAPRATSSP